VCKLEKYRMSNKKVEELISACPALGPIMGEMLGVGDYLWDRGWAERNAGNISVDVTRHVSGCDLGPAPEIQGEFEFSYPVLADRYFLVTGSGRRFRDVTKDAASNACILRISGDASGYSLVWGGEAGPDFKPTSEFPAHLRLHEHLRKNDASEDVVLHTHPNDLIALTHLPEYRTGEALSKVLWCIHPEVKVNLPKGVGFVPYAIPGTEALALATVEGFERGYPVVLWEIHGCVAKARSPMEAFDLIDIVNKAASLVLTCRSAGHVPTGLSEQQLRELAQEFDLKD